MREKEKPVQELKQSVQEGEAKVEKVEGQNVSISLESVTVPVGRIALGTAAVLGVLFLAFVVYKSIGILLLLFLALLIATAIEPIVNLLRRGPFSRSAGILIVYTGLFVIIAAIGYVLVTVFVSQLGDFGSALQNTIKDMQHNVDTIGDGFIRTELSGLLGAAQDVITSVLKPNAAADPEAVTNTVGTVIEVFLA